MPTFEYQAVNDSGERVSGTVASNTMEQALSSLSEHGLTVERINQAAAVAEAVPQAPPIPTPAADAYLYDTPAPNPYRERSVHETPAIEAPPLDQRSYVATSVVGPLAGQVSLALLSRFYRQFGTMLDAGVPIVQALDTLSKQGRSEKLHQVLREIRGHVEAGRAVSAGMQRYPEVFSPLALSLVRAGEEGGFLAQAFKLLADYTDQELALRNLIKRLTFYPKLVLVVAFVLVGGASLLINFMGLKNILPFGFTMVVSGLLLVLFIAAFLFTRVGLANPRIKYNWDALLVRLPFGVGKTVHEFGMSKFGMALSFLYKGGVPIHQALSLAADATGNEYLRARISPASRRLETGAKITDTLRNTEAFSPIVMDMVHTGEHTGNLDQMLQRMSSFYEDEAKTRATQIAHVFSVIILILVAVYVCYILIQAYTNLVGSYGATAGSDDQ